MYCVDCQLLPVLWENTYIPFVWYEYTSAAQANRPLPKAQLLYSMHDAPFNTAIPFWITLTYSLIPYPYTECNRLSNIQEIPQFLWMKCSPPRSQIATHISLTFQIKPYSSTLFHKVQLNATLHLQLGLHCSLPFNSRGQHFNISPPCATRYSRLTLPY
jgi:hypothetical protein